MEVNTGTVKTTPVTSITCNYLYTTDLERAVYRSYSTVFTELFQLARNAYEIEHLGQVSKSSRTYREINTVHWLINLLYNASLDLVSQIEARCCITKESIEAIKTKYQLQCALDRFNCSNSQLRLKVWELYQNLFTISDSGSLLNLRFSSVTQTSITLLWEMLGETPFTIQLFDANDVLLNTYTSNTNFYTITGLNSNTNYSIKIFTKVDSLCYYEDELDFTTTGFFIYVNLVGNGSSDRFLPVRIFSVVVGNPFVLNFLAGNSTTILNSLTVNNVNEVASTVNTVTYVTRPHTGSFTIPALLNQNYTINLEFLTYTGAWLIPGASCVQI